MMIDFRTGEVSFVKKIFFQVNIVIVALVAAALFGGYFATAARAELVVVTFGDSITAGFGGVGPYSVHLQNILGDCARVINKGKRGERTTRGVSRIKGVLSSTNPDYIIIMEGANDAINGLSPSTTKFNLQSMVNRSQKSGAKAVLSTITPNTRDAGVSVRPFNSGIRSIAGAASSFVDQFNRFESNWSSFTLEGLHPNTPGAIKLAEGFAGAIPCSGGGAADGTGGGGCFIATAAFGTAMEPQVELLKEFRDSYLMTNTAGRFFVQKYYRYSPPVADFIAAHDRLRMIVRLSLYPLIGLSYVMTHVAFEAAVLTMIFFLPAALALLRFYCRRRQVRSSIKLK
jgi:lysophospholipase L1-like esterase